MTNILRWQRLSTPEGFKIYRGTGDYVDLDGSPTPSPIGDVAGTVNRYEDTTAVPGQDYYYTVVAYNGANVSSEERGFWDGIGVAGGGSGSGGGGGLEITAGAEMVSIARGKSDTFFTWFLDFEGITPDDVVLIILVGQVENASLTYTLDGKASHDQAEVKLGSFEYATALVFTGIRNGGTLTLLESGAGIEYRSSVLGVVLRGADPDTLLTDFHGDITADGSLSVTPVGGKGFALGAYTTSGAPGTPGGTVTTDGSTLLDESIVESTFYSEGFGQQDTVASTNVTMTFGEAGADDRTHGVLAHVDGASGVTLPDGARGNPTLVQTLTSPDGDIDVTSADFTSGNLLLMCVCSGSGNEEVRPPAGWRMLGGYRVTNCAITILWRVADGTETGQLDPTDGAGTAGYAITIVELTCSGGSFAGKTEREIFRNRVIGDGQAGNSTALTFGKHYTGDGDFSLCVMGGGLGGAYTFTAGPTGHTEQVDFSTTATGTGGAVMAVYTKENCALDRLDADELTGTLDTALRWATAQLSIKPQGPARTPATPTGWEALATADVDFYMPMRGQPDLALEALDFGGNDLHGTAISGGFIDSSYGTPFGPGVAFVATDNTEYLDVPDDAIWALSGDFTISLWYRPEIAGGSGGSSFQTLMGQYLTTGNNRGPLIMLNRAEGDIVFRLSSDGSTITNFAFDVTASGADHNSAEWHHLYLERSSGTLTVWLDGIEVASGAYVVDQANVSATMRFCQYQSGSSSTDFDGAIAEVLVAPTALGLGGTIQPRTLYLEDND